MGITTNITPEAPRGPEVLSRDDLVSGGNRDLRGKRLAGQDLSGLDLSGFDFSAADLSRANLSGANLAGARLKGTILFGADLSGSQLLGADLEGADLTECNASKAGFGGANLETATLFGAELGEAIFTQANLRGADLRTARLHSARLRDADLAGADLSRADLQESRLIASRVHGARFRDVDFRRARLCGISGFRGANWIGANVLDVDFRGAYLLRRVIMDENYLYEFRTQSRLAGAVYWVWWATSDCGRNFLRWALWTALLVVGFGGLFEMVALDHGDHPTVLTSLYYSVVTFTTLGYGDITPASPWAQLLAMFEVSLGYVMLGGLLGIFANKMLRRAD